MDAWGINAGEKKKHEFTCLPALLLFPIARNGTGE